MARFLISGFKCYEESIFHLNSVTILAGSNGTGKSSLIQSLLLIRLAIEKNLQDPKSENYISSHWRGIPISLNDQYKLSLGTNENIFNNKISTGKILFQLDNEEFEIVLEENNKELLSILMNAKIFQNKDIPFWRKKEFYYLNTERLGPRMGLDSSFTNFTHCGYVGEYTAQVLLNNQFLKINEKLFFPNTKMKTLPQQVDFWLNSICPGTTGVVVKQIGNTRSEITLRNSYAKGDILAPNIGFGISYSLPIIISGLIAKPGSIFIVENPEAHLHPKGQFFLFLWTENSFENFKNRYTWITVDQYNQLILFPQILNIFTPDYIHDFASFNEHFVDRNNSLIGFSDEDCKEPLVFDTSSWREFHGKFVSKFTYKEQSENYEYFKEFYIPYLKISLNQINDLIKNNKAPSEIDRIDSNKINNEKIHVHFKSSKNCALNIDGTWKHESFNFKISKQVCETLSEWGFILPQEYY